MKKAALLLLLLGLLVSTSSAQLGISKGIIGGLNLATNSGADVPSGAKSISAYAAGVYLEFNLPGPLSIEAEGLYSMKGSKIEALGVTNTTNAAYVDILVLLKYYLPVPAVSPNLYAGPMYSTLLSAKTKREGTGITSTETDVKSQFASGDFGLVFGAGLEFTAIRIDARYYLGLSALDKDGNLKMYNRVISLYVGLSF